MILENRGSLRTGILLLIPLILSTYTHLWNPIGFPSIYVDENIYLNRTVRVLQGESPQEPVTSTGFYDHPYFGQLFLAGILKMIDYPYLFNSSFNPIININSIENLYLFPRVLMGVLAVIDTFLIFKIVERRYDRRVAFVASVFFSVMPITWITRWILLDNIQLPFILSSILFSLYLVNKDGGKLNYIKNNKRSILLNLLSGVFLGLAIFTKIPAFAIIPVVSYFIYKNNTNKKYLILWFIPVILIPLIWPIYSVSANEFDLFMKGIAIQSNREEHVPLFDFTGEQSDNPLRILFAIDPVFMIIGVIGFIYAIIKRDILVLLWIIPFLIWLQYIGFVSFFHLMMLLPVFCISSAKLVVDLCTTIGNKVISIKLVLSTIVLSIVIFGLFYTSQIITLNVNSSFFNLALFLTQHLPNNSDNVETERVTLITGETTPSWIYWQLLDKNVYTQPYWEKTPINTKMIMIVIEDGFYLWKDDEQDKEHLQKIVHLYNNTKTVLSLESIKDKYDDSRYPYTNIIDNVGIDGVEVKANNDAIKGLLMLTK